MQSLEDLALMLFKKKPGMKNVDLDPSYFAHKS